MNTFISWSLPTPAAEFQEQNWNKTKEITIKQSENIRDSIKSHLKHYNQASDFSASFLKKKNIPPAHEAEKVLEVSGRSLSGWN